MPHFTRRRLQAMLNDIVPLIDDQKARDLLARLEKDKVEQALPAEMELAILWALSRIGDLDIEPEWWGDNKRPDAYTEHLVAGEPAVVEIAAPNDNAISGEEAMDGVAVRIGEVASRLRKGLSDHLYYRFAEESGYDRGVYFRRRLAPVDYELSGEVRLQIEQWITSGAVDRSRLRLVEPGLDVEVEKTVHKQTRYHNTWSTMPPETHSVDDNPLYKLLMRKLAQLKAARHGTHRFIFLGDAGSTLLNRLGGIGDYDPTHRRVSGRQILSHFVEANARSVESVVVIAPVRKGSMMGREKLQWQVSIFNRPGFEFDPGPLQTVVNQLPRPRFEGYQARSLFRQGAYKPTASGWWLGMNITGRIGGPMEVKISSRALIDLLAGRMTVDQFRRQIGESPNMKNFFKHALDSGKTIQGMTFQSGGLDEDDDQLVFALADDPGASPLRLPSPDVTTNISPD